MKVGLGPLFFLLLFLEVIKSGNFVIFVEGNKSILKNCFDRLDFGSSLKKLS